MDAPNWSQSQLRKLGLSIRDGTRPSGALPAYQDVLVWYNELAAEVQRRIDSHDWQRILGASKWETTSRAKTIDTLKQKLQRDHAHPLSSVQDLAGVRFEAEMTLDQQSTVVKQMLTLFGHDQFCVKDLREAPHSGYRGVHLWLRLEGRVEVQVRTHLQGEWANMYETAADFIGREIRYGVMPVTERGRNLVVSLQDLSTRRIAEMERTINDIAAIQEEYSSQLKGLDEYDPEDTLPQHIAETLEAASRIDELQLKHRGEEAELRSMLSSLKQAFEEARRGGV